MVSQYMVAFDGYSRRILWLSIVSSNNNPEIVGKLYLDYVKSVGGCPKKVVGNRGTENSYIAAFQRYFRRNGSMNRQERTVFCIVNLFQISEWKLTGRS